MSKSRRRGARGQEREPLDGAPCVVAPLCALVEEAVSARLDHEWAPIGGDDIDDHLGRCADCRSFEASAATLHRRRGELAIVARAPSARRPALGAAALAAVAAGWPEGRVPARLGFTSLRARWPGAPTRWALLGVLLAFVPWLSLDVLSHIHVAVAADLARHCSTLPALSHLHR